MILSYGHYAFLDKQTAAVRLSKTYAANQEANRDILNQYESAFYNKSCKGVKVPKKERDPASAKKGKPEKTDEEKDGEEEEQQKISPFNQECARINLWPLIQEGKESHPVLYELTARLIRAFYSPLFTGEKRFEYRLLDILLSSAKATLQEEGTLSFEKIPLLKSDLQRIYYKMLKGTKRWDLKENRGYPPLLDYIKADPSQDKICLFHGNLDLLVALFDRKMGEKVYAEAHKPKASPLTKELIEHLSSEMHQISIDPDLLLLLQFGKHYPKNQKQPFVAEDAKSNVYLRKNISIEG